MPRDFRLLVFRMNPFSPQHLSVPLRLFRILSKIPGDIRKSRWTIGINDTGWPILPPFSLVLLIPVVHLDLRILPRIFEKIRNGPTGILRGQGGNWFMKKKPEAKNLVTLSLYQIWRECRTPWTSPRPTWRPRWTPPSNRWRPSPRLSISPAGTGESSRQSQN